MKKRFLSVILVLALCLTMLPAMSVPAAAAGTDTGKAIQLGTGGISDPTSIIDEWAGTIYGTYYDPSDYIYFGTYGTATIKWRVLDADKANDGTTSGAFLLSEYLLDSDVYFNEEYHLVGETYYKGAGHDGTDHTDCGIAEVYQGSDAQNWCRTFATDSNVFSTTEQTAFLGITKTDVEQTESANGMLYTRDWGESNLTADDEVFFLSVREVSDYIGDYQEAPGLMAYSVSSDGSVGSEGTWWLRSPRARYTCFAGNVEGDVENYSRGWVSDSDVINAYSARPAFNLNPSSVLFTSAAVDGKPEVFGAVSDYDGSDWKLTLLDSSRSSFDASVSNISDNTLTVAYSNAKTGANEYVSAIIRNGDTVESYGRLLQVDGTTNKASGTVSITLPDTFNATSDMLYIFNEQYNGDYKTDYASELIQMNNLNYTVTNTLTNLSSNGASTINWKQNYTTTLTADTGGTNTVYAICDDVQVYVGDSQAALTSGYTFTPASDGKSGELKVNAASITGNIKIVAAAKKYAVEVTNSETNFDFGTQTYGYSSVTARTMTIENTGNQPLTVSLPDATDDNFDISCTGTSGTLSVGGSVTITVKPKDGLDANSAAYEKELTVGVTGGSSADFSQTINAKFVVNKANATDAMQAASGESKYGTSGTVDLSAQLAEGYVLGDITTAGADGVLNGTPVVGIDGVLSFAFVDNADNIGKTATVTVPVTSSTNYNPYEIAVTVTVLEKYSQTITASDVTAIYGDSGKKITASTNGDGDLSYAVTVGDAVSVDADGNITILKAGTATITVTAEETDIYAEATKTVSVTINKKDVSVAPKAVSVYVNGTATLELVYTGLVGYETITPDSVELKLYKSDGTEIAVADAVKTAGTYTIKWINYNTVNFSDADNYNVSTSETEQFVVRQQQSSGNGGGGYTPPVQSITVPISGDENTINVNASVSGSKATVDKVDLSKLDTVIGEDVNTGVVTIDFSGLNKSIDTVEIPSDVVKQIAEAVNDPANDAESLEIVLSDGTSIEFDAAALGEKAAQADGLDITISIENSKKATLTTAQKNAVGSNTAYDINVTSGGKHITDMGGKITVHAPYELKSGELPRGVVVYYIDENGNKELCETNYDSEKKRVNWKTDHLSLYMIGYDEELAESCDGGESCPSAAFADLDTNLWYHEYTDFVIENGLMEGTSTTEKVFSPNGIVSRAQVVTVLWRLEGEPVVNYAMTFEDVEEGLWYSEAVRWAASEKIVEGWNNKYAPDDAVTREQLATILWRYAKYKGYDVSIGENTNILSYTDAESISEYAVSAIQWANGIKMMEGYNGQLNPLGETKRSEFAKMITVFIKSVTP